MRRLIAIALLPLTVCLCAVLPEKNLRGWIEVNTPNFRVVSNAEAGETREMAYYFEQARAVFNATISEPRATTGRPVTVIVAKDEGFMRKLWPEMLKSSSAGLALLPALEGEKCYILIRQTSFVPYRSVLVRGNVIPSSNYLGPFRAYVQVFVPLSFGPLPLWLEYGLRASYGNVFRDFDEIRLGGLSFGEFRFASNVSLPMESLLRLDTQGLASLDAQSRRDFDSKSWALVHYMKYSLDTAKPNALSEIMVHVQNGADVLDAVREFVGDPAQLQKQVLQHLLSHGTSALTVPVPPRVRMKDIPTRPLSPAMVAAAIGDFYLQAGRRGAAREQLVDALRLAPGLPEALESYAWLEHQAGNDQAALEMIQKALAKNPESYLGHFYSGAIQGTGATNDAALAQAESELRRAIALNPGFAPAYHALATVLLKHGESVDAAFQNMQQAIRIDPGVSRYYLTTTQIFLKAGRTDLAIPSAKLALLAARTNEDHAAARAVLDSLPKPQVVAPPAPAASVPQDSAAEGSSFRPQLKRRPPPVESVFSARSNALSTRKESGKIASVTCKGFAMDFSLEGPGFTRRLHTDNLVEVLYLPDKNRPGDYDPCKKLVSQKAFVTYAPRTGRDYDGEIRIVEVVRK